MLLVEDLRGYITTALEDDDLDRLLSAAYQAIDEFAGPAGDVTELIVPGPGDLVILALRADDITSVAEQRWGIDTVLSTDDYELVGDQTLRRLRSGTHPGLAWRGRVKVVYTPLDDTENRDRVAIALVEQDLGYRPGLTSQRLGEWSESYSSSGAYQAERAAILASLHQAFVAI